MSSLRRFPGRNDKDTFEAIESVILEEDTSLLNKKNAIIIISTLFLMAHLISVVF